MEPYYPVSDDVGSDSDMGLTNCLCRMQGLLLLLLLLLCAVSVIRHLAVDASH
jgi:hypothetical protein